MLWVIIFPKVSLGSSAEILVACAEPKNCGAFYNVFYSMYTHIKILLVKTNVVLKIHIN
jgi:hypothetical protein